MKLYEITHSGFPFHLVSRHRKSYNIPIHLKNWDPEKVTTMANVKSLSTQEVADILRPGAGGDGTGVLQGNEEGASLRLA